LEPELRATRRHAKKWPVDHLKWTDLACGIGQTYKRAAAAFQIAERTHKPEDLHEWRKRAKDLWYQLRIVKPVDEQDIATLAGQMKKLGQTLGDDHDLFMIGEASKTAGLNCRELEAIADLVQQRRERLQKDAFQLGRRLFSQKPSEFIRRIESYGAGAGNKAN
jgi:CHAD domain-containing protein